MDMPMESENNQTEEEEEDEVISNLYPLIGDENFAHKIARREEYADTKYDGTIYADILEHGEKLYKSSNEIFELKPNQLFIKKFTSHSTPYNSIFLYHGLGEGKTCSAMSITENIRSFMRMAGIKGKIYFIANDLVQKNFQEKFFDKDVLHQDIHTGQWKMNTCVGTDLLDEFFPDYLSQSKPVLVDETEIESEKLRIKEMADGILKEYYEFKTTDNFAKLIDENENKPEFFNHATLVFDEAHSLRLTSSTFTPNTTSLSIKKIKRKNKPTEEEKKAYAEAKAENQRRKKEANDKMKAEAKQKKKDAKAKAKAKADAGIDANDEDADIDDEDEIDEEKEQEKITNLKYLSSKLLQLAWRTTGMKLVMLSATPLFNNHFEILYWINLFCANDKRIVKKENPDDKDFKGFVKKDFFDEDTEELIPEKKLLMRKLLTGYFSFVRGENPYTFPFKIYPKEFLTDEKKLLHTFKTPEDDTGLDLPKYEFNNKTLLDKTFHLPLYVNHFPPNSLQKYAYILAALSTLHLNKERQNYGFDDYIIETNLLAIYFPNIRLNNLIKHFTAEVKTRDDINPFFIKYRYDIVELFGVTQKEGDVTRDPKHSKDYYGNEGFNKIIKQGTHDKLYYYKDSAYPHFFAPENLKLYSAKYYEIANCIKDSQVDDLILIHVDKISPGCVSIGLMLEEMGMENAGLSGNLFNHFHRDPQKNFIPSEKYNGFQVSKKDKEGKEIKDDQGNVIKIFKKYIIISGSMINNKSVPSNTEVQNLINNTKEKYTEIKVIIITDKGTEGIDFKKIRQAHIVQPWYHLNKIDQTIGRVARTFSHMDLKKEYRNVQLFLHVLTLDGEDLFPFETADLYTYRKAEKKAIKGGEITRMVKEISVDCVLNKSQQFKTMNAIVPQTLSNNHKILHKTGDKPFSSVCDYQANCFYTCVGKDEKENAIIKLTNSKYFVDMNKHVVLNRIRNIFANLSPPGIISRERLLDAIQTEKKYPINSIYATLSFMIDQKIQIYLSNKQQGYIVNKKEWYIFQPFKVIDEKQNLSLRLVPILKKRKYPEIENLSEQIVTTLLPEDLLTLLFEILADFEKPEEIPIIVKKTKEIVTFYDVVKKNKTIINELFVELMDIVTNKNEIELQNAFDLQDYIIKHFIDVMAENYHKDLNPVSDRIKFFQYVLENDNYNHAFFKNVYKSVVSYISGHCKTTDGGNIYFTQHKIYKFDANKLEPTNENVQQYEIFYDRENVVNKLESEVKMLKEMEEEKIRNKNKKKKSETEKPDKPDKHHKANTMACAYFFPNNILTSISLNSTKRDITIDNTRKTIIGQYVSDQLEHLLVDLNDLCRFFIYKPKEFLTEYFPTKDMPKPEEKKKQTFVSKVFMKPFNEMVARFMSENTYLTIIVPEIPGITKKKDVMYLMSLEQSDALFSCLKGEKKKGGTKKNKPQIGERQTKKRHFIDAFF